MPPVKDIVISWTEWEEKYKPIRNPNSPDPGFWGCMFETYGSDIATLEEMHVDGKYFWTLVDNNPNSVYLDIISGVHVFNRMGYFVTEVPWEEEVLVSNDPSY